MKCPRCGNELTVSKKDPSYLLCYDCRKKFKIHKKSIKDYRMAQETSAGTTEEEKPKTESPTHRLKAETKIFSRKKIRDVRNADKTQEAQTPDPETEDADSDVGYRFRYANIPPKEIREKQEREMKQAYDELLSIGEEERARKKRGFFGRRKKD